MEKNINRPTESQSMQIKLGGVRVNAEKETEKFEVTNSCEEYEDKSDRPSTTNTKSIKEVMSELSQGPDGKIWEVIFSMNSSDYWSKKSIPKVADSERCEDGLSSLPTAAERDVDLATTCVNVSESDVMEVEERPGLCNIEKLWAKLNGKWHNYTRKSKRLDCHIENARKSGEKIKVKVQLCKNPKKGRRSLWGKLRNINDWVRETEGIFVGFLNPPVAEVTVQ